MAYTITCSIPIFGILPLAGLGASAWLFTGQWGSFNDLEQVSFEALLTRFVKSLGVSVSGYIAPNDAAGLKSCHS